MQIFTLTGEPTHSALKVTCTLVILFFTWKVKYPLHFSFVKPITQQYESRNPWNYQCNQSSHYEKHERCHVPQLYQLLPESEAPIVLLCQLCSMRYTVVLNQDLFKKHFCNQGSHYEKYRQFPLYKGSHHMQPPNRHFLLSAKMNRTEKRILVSPRRMHCTYCGIPQGTLGLK